MPARAVTAHAADAQALSEASAWFARLASGAATPVDHQHWRQWHAQSAANQQAWTRIESVRSRFASLPASLAAPALLQAGASRRSVLRSFCLLAVTGALGGGAYRALPLDVWRAGLRTQVGERRELVLDDGSRLQMDTGTALDVHFDAAQRALRLHAGAILVSTAPDALGRPFTVDTPHGRLRALGTRFAVRLEPDRTLLTVLEHAVEVRPARAPGLARIMADAQVGFDAQHIGTQASAPPMATSWAQGSIVAIDMPLGELVAELARYRRGHLGCDPSVAAMRVSGAFPVDDTDRALAVLTRSFAVQLRRRGDHWLTVAPREL